jgi:hypothetical protein
LVEILPDFSRSKASKAFLSTAIHTTASTRFVKHHTWLPQNELYS